MSTHRPELSDMVPEIGSVRETCEVRFLVYEENENGPMRLTHNPSFKTYDKALDEVARLRKIANYHPWAVTARYAIVEERVTLFAEVGNVTFL